MQTKTFNVYNQENQIVQDAYAMLAANLHFADEKHEAKTLVMTSCKPGVGKTAIAISLAMTMATSGWKVLLVDADMRRPTDAKRLNSETIYGLSDYLKGDKEFQGAICETNITNLSYMAYGKNNNNPINLFCSSRFEEFMKTSKEAYDFILFDTPALSSVVDASLIASKADGTLLVVELGQTTTLSLKPATEQLLKVNANIIGVVLNKVKKQDYMKYFGSYNYFFDAKNFSNKKNKTEQQINIAK